MALPPFRRPSVPIAWLLSLVLTPASVLAQDVAAPAHLVVVDGNATLEQEFASEPATSGLPLVPGDRLRTAAGRAEVLFPDGSILDVDEYTVVDLQANTLVRVAAGRVLLTVAGTNNPGAALVYEVDTAIASARSNGPGEYRIA